MRTRRIISYSRIPNSDSLDVLPEDEWRRMGRAAPQVLRDQLIKTHAHNRNRKSFNRLIQPIPFVSYCLLGALLHKHARTACVCMAAATAAVAPAIQWPHENDEFLFVFIRGKCRANSEANERLLIPGNVYIIDFCFWRICISHTHDPSSAHPRSSTHTRLILIKLFINKNISLRRRAPLFTRCETAVNT